MMHTRNFLGLSSIALAVAVGAQAQVPPATRSVQQAVEAARSREVHDALIAAQTMGRVDMQLAATEARLAMEHARLASHGQVALATQEAELALAQARLQVDALGPELFGVQAAVEALAAGFGGGYDSRSWGARLDALRPEFRALPQDPADSVYRMGRERLNSREWQRAAELFRRIRTEERFERSGYRPDAYYWEAFALAQRGEGDDLRRAREVLEAMKRAYPDGQMIRDANQLAATIDGRLARRGDAEAAESIYRLAEAEARASRGSGSSRSRSSSSTQCSQDEQDDLRIAALSALLNVDSDRTVPVLREVMQRRDECSAPLRRRALMLIARSRDPEVLPALLDAARNDPDEGVRDQAVLLIGTVKSPEATRALQSMLTGSNDVSVQRRALMALTQQGGEEATAMLRDYAARDNVPDDLRRHAILLLMGRRGGGAEENRTFLRTLFGRTSDPDTRAAILQGLMSDRSEEGMEWLMSVALDSNQNRDLRRQALFIASQSDHMPVDRLSRLFDQAGDAEMKEQVLFALARRDEPAAFDKLVTIARSDSDVEIRKKAIFWLGQSKDPRAPEILLELIR